MMGHLSSNFDKHLNLNLKNHQKSRGHLQHNHTFFRITFLPGRNGERAVDRQPGPRSSNSETRSLVKFDRSLVKFDESLVKLDEILVKFEIFFIFCKFVIFRKFWAHFEKMKGE